MEEGLLSKKREEESCGGDGRRFGAAVWVEVKRLGCLAGPMVAVTLSQYFLQVISVMMVGHLGELSLSSTSIDISIAGVTRFSFLLGMACALETLSEHSYGAKQYYKLGMQTYTTIFSLVIVCIPLAILRTYMGKVLVFIGQDPLISREAGKFLKWLVSALFSYSTLQPLIRFFHMQSMIYPMLLSSCVTICFHIPLCWVMVFKSGLSNLGAAVAIGVSMWLNVTIHALYMKFSTACTRTRSLMSWEIFHGVKEFFRYAIPYAVIICLDLSRFELLVLLFGLLPNPQLEASVLSVCLNPVGTLYAIPYRLTGAVCTRVSNELGAGNPEGARLSVVSVMFIAVAETVVVSATLFACRHVFGYVYNNEKEVVDYVADMTPLLCLSVITDSLEGTVSSVARGCGWQHIGAYINLASFCLCGISISASFWLNLRGKGLWIGIVSGATLQTILLSIITSCTNWNEQAARAREGFVE
nr:protein DETOXIFICATION 12-like [Ipomoea batatas]